MGIGRQSSARFQFAAEVFQFLLRKPPLQEGPSVNARGSVTLKVDDVAGVVPVLTAEEMVKANLVKSGGAGVGGNVAADAVLLPVRADDHRHGVPAHQTLDPSFEFLAAG